MCKWICIGLSKPPSQNEKYFLESLSLALTKMSVNTKMLC